MSSTRREFLTTTAAIAASALAARYALGQPATEPALSDIPELKTPDSIRKGDMLYRKLGKTGETVSLLGLGGFHLGALPTQEASTKLLRRAVDSGVTFMDNSWDYRNGLSEERMGNALKDGYRQKVFLMTKFDGRTKDAAAKQIDESLKRLQTDTIDLIQIHENIRMSDADRCFAKGGCIEAVLAAKNAGKIRFIGFTGHKDPAIHLHMLDVAAQNVFHFDTCQMPLNVLDAHYHSFARAVLPRLLREGIAPLAMKTLGSGSIAQANLVPPIDCLHYAMNLPVATVINGIDSEARLDQALAAVKSFQPLTPNQLAAILDKTKTAAANGKLEAFKTSEDFDSTAKNPQWLGT